MHAGPRTVTKISGLGKKKYCHFLLGHGFVLNGILDQWEFGDYNDIGNTAAPKKWDFNLNNYAISLGFTSESLAEQIRAAIYGYKVYSTFRGKDKLEVYVRLPEQERNSVYDIEHLFVFTPNILK